MPGVKVHCLLIDSFISASDGILDSMLGLGLSLRKRCWVQSTRVAWRHVTWPRLTLRTWVFPSFKNAEAV